MPLTRETKIIIFCAVTGAIIAVAVLPVAAPGILGGIYGISATGPAAGSLFAALQTAGAVIAGGSFATIQSIAMGGAISLGVFALAAISGLGIGGLLGLAGTRIGNGRS